jgi:hypothetical protein
MIELEEELRGLLEELGAQGRRFALVGGLAVSVRAEPRFTRDVDLVVSVEDDRDAESLILALQARGYHAVATVEHESVDRLSTVRLRSPGGLAIDLLFASSGIEPEILREAGPVQVPGLGTISTAAPEELLAMKILSMGPTRLKDRMDAQHLLLFVEDLDLDRVRARLQEITARGYHRDRDLLSLLDEVITEVEADQP